MTKCDLPREYLPNSVVLMASMSSLFLGVLVLVRGGVQETTIGIGLVSPLFYAFGVLFDHSSI